MELLPRPVEALRGVRVCIIAADGRRNYAVADTGELWAWGCDGLDHDNPLGHGEQVNCPLPKRIESLRGIKLDAVAAYHQHTMALAEDGSVFAWDHADAAQSGALGRTPFSDRFCAHSVYILAFARSSCRVRASAFVSTCLRMARILYVGVNRKSELNMYRVCAAKGKGGARGRRVHPYTYSAC
jgi:hypothetical protein